MNNNLDDDFKDIDTIFRKRDTKALMDQLYGDGPKKINKVDPVTQDRLDKMRNKSKSSCNEEYKPRTEKAKSSFMTKAIVSALSVALALNIGVGMYRSIQTSAVRNDMLYENTEFMKDATYSYHNNELDQRITMYFEDRIGNAILGYNGDIDLDSLIYMTYSRINYNVVGTLDKVFSYMNRQIANNPEAFSDDVKKACQYASFNEYMAAHGFTDIDEYKKTMHNILTAYSKDTMAEDKLNELLESIQVQDIETLGGPIK